MSEPGLEKRAGREKWSEARRKMSEQVLEVADSAIAEVRGTELAEFNAADLRTAKALRAQIDAHLNAAAMADSKLDAMTLRTLSAASEATQRIGRLALGASTENNAVTTKELPSSVNEFV